MLLLLGIYAQLDCEFCLEYYVCICVSVEFKSIKFASIVLFFLGTNDTTSNLEWPSEFWLTVVYQWLPCIEFWVWGFCWLIVSKITLPWICFFWQFLAAQRYYCLPACLCTNNALCSSSDELGKKFWKLRCDSKARGEDFIVTCDYLVIATGHHAKPKIPEFPGQENFAGELRELNYHSCIICCQHFIRFHSFVYFWLLYSKLPHSYQINKSWPIDVFWALHCIWRCIARQKMLQICWLIISDKANCASMPTVEGGCWFNTTGKMHV